ncbi:MAG: putative selenate ABC transporter substrate-binding protein [Myxacorys chilensis ATA2-1-KO14]|jgi:phosphonate transport system substrate-binding protein|nr:putative selenate ABC transporter substrate-binding protein [Myxacorys chilensis ATA2-1-KO14]
MKRLLVSGFLSLSLLPLAACSNNSSPNSSANSAAQTKTFVTGAIPDQDAEKLQRLYGKLSQYLEAELKIPVSYKPVTDYTAAVTAFKVGDLDMVWFGGLTGVQARLQVPGAEALAQRDIDAKFHSVFIANKNSGIGPINDVKELTALKGHSFTFGSESSTSGRLMPQYFLQQAGVKLEDFKGQSGFSQNHDATIALVTAGTYDAGVLNEQVWQKRLQEGKIDRSKIDVIWRSPEYYDYHWVINPSVKQRFGDDFPQKVQAALMKLDPNVPEQKEILELFGATKFVPTKNENYARIEQVGREIGKIK